MPHRGGKTGFSKTFELGMLPMDHLLDYRLGPKRGAVDEAFGDAVKGTWTRYHEAAFIEAQQRRVV